MRTRGLRLIASAGLLLLTGGWTDTPADLKTRAHTVAIVSTLGDAVSTGNLTLDGAGFDDTAFALMAQTVRDDIPGVAVVAVTLPHDELVHRANADGFGDAGLERVRQDIRPWLKNYPVDFVLVLLPTAGDVGASVGGTRTSNHLIAFGMSAYGGQTSALLEAVVIDGRTGEVVANMRARAFGDIADAGKALAHPDPGLKAGLIERFNAMLSTTVPGLVRSAGL